MLKENQEAIMEEGQPEQYFFSDNNAIQKKKKTKRPIVKPYNITRIKIKARNFLTNISHNSVTEENLFNRNFVIDVYVLLCKNSNPCSIERKIQEKKSRNDLHVMGWMCSSKFLQVHLQSWKLHLP